MHPSHRDDLLVHARALELIAALRLEPHPEGGYFRETHRSVQRIQPDDDRPPRAALTTIYFLLIAGEVSRWHRVRSDEAWHFIEGDTLQLHAADSSFENVTTTMLGPLNDGVVPVSVISAGAWQAAQTTGDYTLVACTVGPGFDFDDFELLRAVPDDAHTLQQRQPAFMALL